MKKIIIFEVAIATLFAFSSCQKEDLENTSKSSVRIITAKFENNATKTTPNDDGKTPEWAEGDVLRLLNSSSCQDVEIISGSGTPESGKAYIDGSGLKIGTTLTGTLYAVYPASATAMTNCSGSINFTIPAVQDGTFASANICVAKSSTTDETNKDNLVFRNATAVLKITTVADVVGVDITATNNIAGLVTATFSDNDISLNPNLTGKFVSAVCKSAPSGNVFYLAAAPGATGSTTVKCYKIDKSGETSKGSKELKKNVIYSMDLSSMTIETTCDLTGTKGELNGHEFVIIRAKYDGTNDSYLKWATRNVGATGDTGTDSYGKYFMWGDTQGQEAGTKTGGEFIYYAFNKEFSWTNCPFLFAVATNPLFEKYVPSEHASSYGKDYNYYDNKTTLDISDDAANANWGGTWRMPTGGDAGEFMALKDATYWNWDWGDSGYYVYTPQFGDAGKVNSDGTGTYDKSNALLFFPAAGYGNGTTLSNVGVNGRYWSSSLYSSFPYYAHDLDFPPGSIYPHHMNYRYFGFSVRPVSD